MDGVGPIAMQYKLILGNQVYSGWTLRAWLILKHVGADFQEEVVPLYTDEFDRFRKDCFPARQLPTLIAYEGGARMIIWDSLSIAEFLHERHPASGVWPTDTSMRATARSLCAEMHAGFKALRSNMPVNLKRRYHSFMPDNETQADIARICDLWAWTRKEFNQPGPYLFGEAFTAADAFFAPIACRFRTYSIELNEDASAYVDALMKHPSKRIMSKLPSQRLG